jgi:hypothetical protein
MLDVSSLTLGEVAKIEELSGASITAIGEDAQPKGKALAAMVFVVSRRGGEALSWNQACALTIEQANTILGVEDDEDEVEVLELPEGDAEFATAEGDEAEDAARQAAGLPAKSGGRGKGKGKPSTASE